MDAELRVLLRSVLADPSRVREVPIEQVGPVLIELASLQVQLAARLLAPRPADPGNEAGVRADRLLTPGEAAGILGVTVRWLYRHAGTLPFTRRLSRRALRFSEAGLHKYITYRQSRHSAIP